MAIHDALPLFIIFVGLFGGFYILTRAKKMKHDWVLELNFIVLGCINLYVGVVYLLVLLGIIDSIPTSELALFMRPANLLLLVLPLLISWRMGI